MESFGSLLRRYRLEAGLTQQVLADEARMSESAVGSLERGTRRAPRPDTVDTLATVLGLNGERRAAFRAAARVPRGPRRDPVRPSAGPHELPADVHHLIGRDDLLGDVEDLLTPSPAGPGGRGSPRVVCLFGPAGVGKSATAIRSAHRVADQYPDGQVFVRLRDGDGEPVGVSAVVGRVLRSLGVDTARIPRTVEDRCAVLRDELAGRAMLVILDDASEAEQVRPFLGAAARCAVLVTSWRRLGLADADHFELGPLGEHASRRLLSALSPIARAGSRSAAVESIVRHCAGLPLALRIVGMHLAVATGDGELERFATALGEESRRLDALVAGDLAVRRSLGLTLRAADDRARTLFERLPVIRNGEFSGWVVAALLDSADDDADTALRQLETLGLVRRHQDGPEPRYELHSLVRAYAAERLAGDDSVEAARVRYLETLLRLVTRADRQLRHGLDLAEGVAEFDGVPAPLADRAVDADPMGWLDQESAAVLAAVDSARRYGRPELAGALALRMWGYLAVRDDQDTRAEIFGLALDAVVRSDLTELEARLQIAQLAAMLHLNRGDLRGQTERALRSARRSGSVILEVKALVMTGTAAQVAGDSARAESAQLQALELIDRNPGLSAERPVVLSGLGSAHHLAGDPVSAVAAFREACELEPRPTRKRAVLLVNLAEALADLGTGSARPASAALEEARAILSSMADDLGLAHVEIQSARVAVLDGDHDRAASRIAFAARVLAERDEAVATRAIAIGTQRLRVAQAELAGAEGRAAEALEVLDRAAGEMRAFGFHEGEIAVRLTAKRLS